jgi:hypothetical protein
MALLDADDETAAGAKVLDDLTSYLRGPVAPLSCGDDYLK